MRSKLLILISLLPAMAGPAFSQDKPDPLDVLQTAMKDTQKGPPTLLALRATDDKDLLVVLEACSRSGDKKLRLFATTAVGELGGKDAAPILQERLKGDPAMLVRSEALIHLLAFKAISDDQLRAALNVDDESIQCISARSLVQRGRVADAQPVLQRLAFSKDLSTSCMARLSLMSIDGKSHRQDLLAAVRDPDTPEEVLTLLMGQILEEKVAAGKELAEAVIASGAHSLVKVQAYQALAAVSPQATDELAGALTRTDDLILRVHLVRLLAQRPGGPAKLQPLAKGSDVSGILARFELARNASQADKLAAAAAEALALGHPVVIDSILMAAKKDAKEHPDLAAAYVEPLADFIHSVPMDPENMQQIHHRAAAAASLLADIATPAAIAALEKILSGPYSAMVRATAAGLGKSNNKELVCRLSRPLLKSVYHDLAVDGALNLGRWDDPAAAGVFDQVIANPTESPVLRTLACWYSLKIQGRSRAAAAELAKLVK